PDIVELEENHWQVAGSTPVADAEEALGVSLRDEESAYDTFGGFVIANLGYIPQDGETPTVTYQNLTVKVLQLDEKRIEMTEVERSEPEDGEATAASADGEDEPEVRT
ncbi:MAG: hypothetical protein IKC59_01895, partial [Clostridia bacterium]|nr:hypothetical protein [Clostridia bacterium]